MSLYYSDKLKSSNPAKYGIINANEISGHRSISDLIDLYSLSDAILSSSGTNENNDALGQFWYVVNEEKFYQLTDWNARNSADGWTDTGLSDYATKDYVNTAISRAIINALNTPV